MKSVAAEAETKEEIGTEITRTIEAGTVEITVTGNAQSAITRTSLSEPNAIAVVSQKVEAAETIEEAVVEVTAETETIEIPAKVHTQITTGHVASVKTQTSHSELNATAVAPLKEGEEALASNGKAMNVEQVIEEMHHSLELEIGSVLSVENLISPNAMIALAVDVPRELADQSKEVIIAN